MNSDPNPHHEPSRTDAAAAKQTSSLMHALLSSRGNAAACLWTEPLWGIPFFLYTPFLSVYMLALGVSESQIGLIASVGLGLQVFAALIGGAITDKIGRRRTTFMFDMIAWALPALIWMFAQDAHWFFAAAVLNSLMRITATSWTCLLTEDAPVDMMVHYWAWVNIAGIMVGLVSPVAGLMIERWTLVPTMRGIFAFTFVSMTAKFVILYIASTETAIGVKRMAETHNRSILSLVAEYRAIVRLVLRSRLTLVGIALMAVVTVYNAVRGSFFAVLLTRGLDFLPHEIGWFPAMRSAVMLLCYFLVLPHLHRRRHSTVITIGLLLTAAASFLLVVSPVRSYLVVSLSTVIEAVGTALIVPFFETLLFRVIDPNERARVLSVANVLMLAVATPFGWIAGVLSEVQAALPFVLLGVMLLGGVAVLATAGKRV